mgnify:FL=1
MEIPALRAVEPNMIAQFAEQQSVKDPTKPPSQAEVKKAAEQFEAVIVRQLIAPAIDPLFAGEGVNGGGIYGYMLTSTLADKITDGGGLGFASMLSREFTADKVSAVESSPTSNPHVL